MYFLFIVLSLCVGLTAASTEWCYTGCPHTPTHWADLAGSFCGGNRQSPVNIVPSHVMKDDKLGNFTFVNFSSREAFQNISNNGHTIKITLKENMVEFYGGGLNGTYSAIQFHFHWGDTEHHPGSEHLINGQRFRMEMHVVSLKKGLTTNEALADPEGIAVLGFLIDAVDNVTKSEPWTNLTSHLNTSTVPEVRLTDAISISDLIGDVDLTKFYRYKGSLTTPSCNEVVIWTVFAEPIQVHTDLLQLFPKLSELTNVYRPMQDLNGREVYASPAVQLPPAHPWCYDDHECVYSPTHWQDLSGSYCGGTRQSPININSNNAVMDKNLKEFTFHNFDNKHAIDYVTNTGHTVKYVLKEGLVEVSGGGLGHVYSVLQFHFHWANTASDSVGSEHLLNSKRYSMEMHIVTQRKDLTLDEALMSGNGLAVLGFFVEAAGGTRSSSTADTSTQETTPPSNTEAWKQLTSYFSHIQSINSMAKFTSEVSIDDLLGDVSRSSYYRYNGSLTTPNCNEAVVWTVFKESVKVDHSLMLMFPNEMGYHDVYRPAQNVHERTIYSTSASTTLRPAILVLLLQMCFSLEPNAYL